MLALSIVAPNGTRIATGRKTLEIRSWCPPRWPLRDLLIIENHVFLTDEGQADPHGVAVAVIDVDDVHAWQPSEQAAACAPEWRAGMWAWHVTNVRPVAAARIFVARRKLYEIEVEAMFLVSTPETWRHGPTGFRHFRQKFSCIPCDAP
ncbi:MAG: ASCH domain-containing protein [Rhodanobacter sp.]